MSLLSCRYIHFQTVDDNDFDVCCRPTATNNDIAYSSSILCLRIQLVSCIPFQHNSKMCNKINTFYEPFTVVQENGSTYRYVFAAAAAGCVVALHRFSCAATPLTFICISSPLHPLTSYSDMRGRKRFQVGSA